MTMTFEQPMEFTNEHNTFMRKNRIRITSVDLQRSRAEAVVTRELLNLGGSVHGGVYFTMADACCGALARADGRSYVTTDTSLRILKAADAGTLQAEACVLKRGRTLSFFRVCIRQKESEALLAEGAFNFFCT